MKDGAPPPPWPSVMNYGREFAEQLEASARCACCALRLLVCVGEDLELRESTAGAAVIVGMMVDAICDGQKREAALLAGALEGVLEVSPPHDEVLITAAVSAAAGELLR